MSKNFKNFYRAYKLHAACVMKEHGHCHLTITSTMSFFISGEICDTILTLCENTLEKKLKTAEENFEAL